MNQILDYALIIASPFVLCAIIIGFLWVWFLVYDLIFPDKYPIPQDDVPDKVKYEIRTKTKITTYHD